MSRHIHDGEPDTSEVVVRALLNAECPQWASAPLEYLSTSGTDNAMWRVRLDDEPDVVARLPRRPGAAAGVTEEMAVLHRIGRAMREVALATPRVRHVGEPSTAFPHHWSVLEWIDGRDAWTDRDDLERRPLDGLAVDLARAVHAIRQVPAADVVRRPNGGRGGPIGPLLERLEGWLSAPEWNAEDLLDVHAVRRLADEARDVIDEPVTESFAHGDLIPGNLLVDVGRLTAVIDWGGAGRGDVAQDLAPAWAVLPATARSVFRAAVGADDAAWIRGRTFELEHAVGGVLYYVPKRHPLGDVMARTLARILDDV